MVKKYTTENGLTVLLEPIKSVVSASLGIWVKSGSRNESVDQYGYAHFVEHMLFKGTKNYSAQEIAKIIDRVGGQHNAATNREYTCYYINIVSDHLELAFNILSDMYYNSLFDSAEMEKEKNVIMEEIRMYDDAPDELIHDVFIECMLSQHPLSHSILGTMDHIKDSSRDTLLEYYNGHYNNDNVIIAIAGNIDESNIKSLVEKYFSENRKSISENKKALSSEPQRILTKYIERDLEQVHFCLGTEGIHNKDDDRWALYSLSTIFGGSMSSRLFQNIREKEGISYSIYSFHSSYSDCGVYGIYCATNPEKFQRAVELAVKECKDLVNKGVSKEELEDAKTFMIGNLALSLESVEVRMSQLAKNEMIYGRYFDFNEMIDKIKSVSMDDFVRISERLFKDTTLSIVAVGNDSVDIDSLDLTV